MLQLTQEEVEFALALTMKSPGKVVHLDRHLYQTETTDPNSQYFFVTNVNPQLESVTEAMRAHGLEMLTVVLLNQKYTVIQYQVRRRADLNAILPVC